MWLEKLIEGLPDFNAPDEVLVCEADFVGLRGAVMQKNGDMLNVAQEVYAEELDLNDAVKSLISQARKKGWKGKQSILLTPAVALTPAELNIPPNNKLNPQQMMEAVNWEVEPIIMQQSHLRIGQILIANGYLTSEQVETILADQHESHQNNEGNAAFKRLGEFALDYGYVSQGQLDQCLTRQLWFKAVGDDLQSNWVPQTAHIESEAGLHPWLLTGMSLGLLRQWQAAFVQHEVNLVQCYPLTGSTLPILSGLYKAKTSKANLPDKHLLLEWHEGQLTAVQMFKQQVTQTMTLAAHRQNILHQLSDTYHTLAIEKPDVCSFIDSASQSEEEAKQLLNDFNQLIQTTAQTYPIPTGHYSLGMRGAAAHFLFKRLRKQLPVVTVADPKPSLLQRFEVRAMLAAGLTFALIAISELSMLGWSVYMDIQRQEIAPDLKKVNDSIARIQSEIDTVQSYKTDIKGKKKEVAVKQAALSLISTDLPERNRTLSRFLVELEKTVSEDVVINSITEDTILGFTLDCWSVSEQSAQTFVRRLQIAVHDMGYQLKDITVTQRTGRLGLLGYAITFKATTLNDEEWAAAKLNPYARSYRK